MHLNRRQFLHTPFALASMALCLPAHANTQGRAPELGSHNDFDIEWWYLTGFLQAPNSDTPLGVQVTFFRKRVASTTHLNQALAAKHLVFAHAAVAVPPSFPGHTGQLRHSQRTARWNGADARPHSLAPQAYPSAWAGSQTMDVGIVNAQGAWYMRSHDTSADSGSGSGSVSGSGSGTGTSPTQHVTARTNSHGPNGFELELSASATREPIWQGVDGLSQKGPDVRDTSWYTTHAQLDLSAKLALDGHTHNLQGRGWLDHEWSQGFMPAGASGWDWVGFNFDDGSALMAFQLRDAQGNALWAGGSWQSASGQTRSFAPSELRFAPLSQWRSPRTGITYPVAWQLTTPQGEFVLQAVMPDQELDSRQSTGTVYWEGLCGLYEVGTTPRKRGAWGYLEMTGYGQAIRL